MVNRGIIVNGIYVQKYKQTEYTTLLRYYIIMVTRYLKKKKRMLPLPAQK